MGNIYKWRIFISIKSKNAVSYMTNVDVFQNHISNSYRSGIEYNEFTGVDCECWGNYLYNCSGLDVNGRAGIEGTNGLKIFNNTIYSDINGGSGIWATVEGLSGNTGIFNNLIIGAGTNWSDPRGIRGDATNDSGGYNWFYDILTGRETSGITSSNSTIGIDPLAIGEYLTIDSPCRDAGISVTGVVYPSRDIDGYRVMSDNSTIFPDVGCHEFHIKTTTTIPEIF